MLASAPKPIPSGRSRRTHLRAMRLARPMKLKAAALRRAVKHRWSSVAADERSATLAASEIKNAGLSGLLLLPGPHLNS